MTIDDSLEDIRWIHGLGGESLLSTSYGILPNLKENYFLPFETDRDFFAVCSVNNSGQSSFYHTPGQRPPHATGHFVNTVALRRVGRSP